MTQEKLAELAQLSTTAISNIESGKACPNFKNIVSLATTLEISIDFLIAEEQMSIPPKLNTLTVLN